MYEELTREQLIAELAKARAELARASEAGSPTLTALLEQLPVACILSDADLRMAYCNAAAERIFGVARTEITGKFPWEVMISPALRERATPVFAALREGNNEEAYISPNIRADGTEIICEWRNTRLLNADGSFEGLLSTAVDVSERVRAEQALRQSERDLRRSQREYAVVAERGPDIISRLDRDLRMTYLNAAAEAVSGLPRERLMGHRPRIFRREGGARVEAAYRKALDSGVPGTVEYEIDTAVGRRWYHTQITPEADSEGVVQSLTTIARDVTELKEAEEARSRSQEEFQRLADNAADVITRFDRDFRHVYANKALEKLMGRPNSQVIGQRPRLLQRPDPEGAQWRAKFAEVFATGEGTVIEYDSETPSGRRYFQSSIVPEFAPDGTVETILNVARDITELKAAETELRLLMAEQARLGAVVAASDDAIVSVNADGRVTTWNAGAERLYGRSADEVLGLESSVMLEPNARRGEIQALVAGVMASGEAVTIETERVRKDGSTVHVSAQYFAINDEAGNVSGAGCIARDITQRVAMEQAVRENEARFRELVDELQVGLVVLKAPDWHVEVANRASREQFGLPTGEVTGQELMRWLINPMREDGSLFVPSERPVVKAITSRSPVRGVVMGFTTRTGLRWVIMDATPTVDDDGQITEVICTFSEITARKMAEEATRASESRFRAVVETMPAAIWAWDGRDQLFLNQALVEMTGYTREELTDEGAFDRLFSREDSKAMVERGNARLRGEDVAPRYEVNITRRDGQVRTLEVRAAVIELESGPAALICAFDVTERKRAEEERQRLDAQVQHTQKLESLGVLAGGIAHDFNNLLVSMLGNAGLALLELPPESPARQTVLAIELAAQRAAELTRQMLAYSGRGRFVVEPLNLSRLVEEMAHLLEVAVSKSATVKYHFAPNLPPIDADATQVRQVVMNLITNASDAIGEGSGVIAVSTGVLHADHRYLAGTYLDNDLPEGEYVYIDVSDTGAGMDEETRQRIFDPFFTTKFTGRGLGLAAVLGIVRGHRGAIKIYSEVGRGTTFKVLFPTGVMATSSSPTAQHVPEEAAAGPQRTVLVVDDDETVRLVTRRLLERMGFAVSQAAGGADAVALYSEHGREIDLVLLDMTMPHMDGEATFRELRRLDESVRVLLMSGYSEADATEQFSGKGLAGFIQKPFRAPELLGKITEALA